MGEDPRQNEGGVTVAVVDDDLKVRLGQGAGPQGAQHFARVEFERPRRKRQQADLVHSGPAKIFSKEKILDLSLGGLIDIDAALVHDFNENGVGVAGIDARVHAAVAAEARRIARERQR